MLPTVLIVICVMSAFGWIMARVLESEVRQRANGEAIEQTDRILDSLSTIDTLSSEKVRAAMRMLVTEGQRLGAVSVHGTTSMGGSSVPDLQLGGSSQVGNFGLVDRIKELTGETATLFVKKGDSFIRVSTNVLKSDGSRAIGTVLDPQGQAFAAIQEGRSFYGVVNILGAPYMAAYEPMRDASGQVAGIWYVGSPLAAVAGLGEHISQTRILDSGYVALLQANGKVMFKSDQVKEEEIHRRLEQSSGAGWTVISKPFDKWGYTLLAAYPEADISGRIHQTYLLVLSCTVVMSLLVVGALYVLLARLVLTPIRGLAARMEKADLNTSFVENRDDEIGALAKAFDSLIKTFREALVGVARTSEQLASASEEIAAAAAQGAEGSRAQSDQVTQVATAMQEMSSTVVEVSSNSSKAAADAHKAAETAKLGGKVVNEALVNMRSIADTVTATAVKIEELGKNSGQIGRIVAVIEDIADQTNLLALNAAIEAARAGDQGRGFAVVADEVRKLAERTTHATKEIAEVIEKVQVETSKAVDQMQAGTKQVEAGVATTAKAGASLQEIIAAAQQVGDMISQIATAATQQTSTAEQINSNVEQIAKIAEESAAGGQQSAKACQDLSALAMDLQQLVSRFKLSDTHTRRGTGAATGTERKPAARMHTSAPLSGNTNDHSALDSYGFDQPFAVQ
jgi:methyl-accepting chemotaxis protein